jgi:hypothetical protein
MVIMLPCVPVAGVGAVTASLLREAILLTSLCARGSGGAAADGQYFGLNQDTNDRDLAEWNAMMSRHCEWAVAGDALGGCMLAGRGGQTFPS